jgi:hypothetical protein
MLPESEDTFSMPSSHVVLDQVDITFDDQCSVALAGLLLPATLAERRGDWPGPARLPAGCRLPRRQPSA